MDTPAAIVAALQPDRQQSDFLNPPPSLPVSHRPSASLSNVSSTNNSSPSISSSNPTGPATTAAASNAAAPPAIPSNPASARKLAAFRLQSLISDPTFADQFLYLGGLAPLCRLVVTESGNTLAYGLGALARLVDLDVGVDCAAVGTDVVERAVAVVSEERLVNILRGGLSLLVGLVGTAGGGRGTGADAGAGSPPLPGALPPSGQAPVDGYALVHATLPKHASFFTSLASHLGSADHGLGTSALQLINGLVRGALAASRGYHQTAEPNISTGPPPGSNADWTALVKQLQDVGVIRAVYGLARQGHTDADLASSLAEFEALTKRMLGRWRAMRVNERVPEHVRALGVVYLAGNRKSSSSSRGGTATGTATGTPIAGSTATTTGWRRIGFLSGSGAAECAAHPSGFLGLMDLADFVRRHSDPFSRYLNEQAFQPEKLRCPFGRASLAVTELLFQYFCVELMDAHGDPDRRAVGGELSSAIEAGIAAGESAARPPPPLNPLVLHWSRLHTATLQAFLRLWRETGAEVGDGPDENADFDRVKGLVKVLIAEVSSPKPVTLSPAEQAKAKLKLKGSAPAGHTTTTATNPGGTAAGAGAHPKGHTPRPSVTTTTTSSASSGPSDISAVETDMAATSLAKLRARQVEILDTHMAARWAARLGPVKRELENEALQFVREQRIRCLLAGAWFEEQKPAAGAGAGGSSGQQLVGAASLFPPQTASARGSHGSSGGHVSSGSGLPPQSQPQSQSQSPPQPQGQLQSQTQSPDVGTVRYARLAVDRRYLYWHDFPANSPEAQAKEELPTSALANVVDLSVVSAVVSNTSATENGMKTVIFIKGDPNRVADGTGSDTGGGGDGPDRKLRQPHYQYHHHPRTSVASKHTATTSGNAGAANATTAAAKDTLLTLHPRVPMEASEWLDGLLMVLNQQPITAATANLVGLLVDTGLRVRLLNVPLEDEDEDGEDDGSDDDYDEYDDGDGDYDGDGDGRARARRRGSDVTDDEEISPDTPMPDAAVRDGRPLQAHPVKRMGTGRRVLGGSMRDLKGKRRRRRRDGSAGDGDGGGGGGHEHDPFPTALGVKAAQARGMSAETDGHGRLRPVVWPSREGTEDPYWYAIGGST